MNLLIDGNNMFKKIKKKLLHYGIHLDEMKQALKGNPAPAWFENDLAQLKQQQGEDTAFPFGKLWPIYNNRKAQGGTMRGHYFHQDLQVAKLIYKANPVKHLDIGSRVDGFVAHVASFRPIELIDIRPINSQVGNISFRQADLMQLPPDLIHYCDSVSSLNVIEHFGLGRYNDPIDYWGHVKAIKNIAAILKPGGTFYFSVPIGPQRIEFNAHRIFSLAYLQQLLQEDFTIQAFSYVDNRGDFFEDIVLTEEVIQTNAGCTFGCGIYTLIKRS